MYCPSLAQFYDRSQIGNWFPTVRYQSTNPSPCAFGPIDADCMVKWRPVGTDLTDLISIQAVEQFVLAGTGKLPTHKQHALAEALQFVTSYWSAPLDCRFGYARIVLDCGVWNEADLSRKRVALRDAANRMLQTESDVLYPIAWNINSSGVCIAMNLSTGEICTTDLESDGRECLAATLSDFLNGLRCVDAYFSETVQSF